MHPRDKLERVGWLNSDGHSKLVPSFTESHPISQTDYLSARGLKLRMMSRQSSAGAVPTHAGFIVTILAMIHSRSRLFRGDG